MKRLSRGRSVTAQAVNNNSKPEKEGKRPVSGKKDSREFQQPISLPNSRSSVETNLQSKKLPEFQSKQDAWIDPFSSSQYNNESSHLNVASNFRSRNTPVQHQSSPKDIRRVDRSPPTRSFLRSSSPATSTTTRTRKSSFSSSSTLHESSITVPITIVVTTPTEEEFPVEEQENAAGSYFPGPSIRKFRNDSTMSLPAIHTPFVLDRNLLMPPINRQVDTRNMRKAREFGEIRHFLIGFLNTKGSQLPRTLRTRIMSVYGITDANLDPRIVAKFGGEGADLDEGIVLDLGLQTGSVPTDLDHKRILEMAFQSILPPVSANPAQDIMAARRKRMSAPLRTASLYSVDSTFSTSSVSSQMSLSGNSKSKQTLDTIMNNRALLQSMKPPSIRAPSASSPPRSLKSQPPTSSSSFFKRRSLQVQPQNFQQTLVLPQPKICPSLENARPQSLHRHKTEPVQAKSAPSALKLPTPAFNQKFSKSRHLKTESSPSLSTLSHRPAVSSQLSRSPLTATFPQRPLSLVQERRTASIDLDSETEKEDSPTESPDALYMKASWAAPPSTPTPATKISIQPAPKATRELKRASKQIPKPIIIAPLPKPQELPVQLPSPMTPTHPQQPIHKALTRSEVSDLEKPFYVHSRRSSSTLDAVFPKTPTSPHSDGSKFPSHPAFAPLEKEKSRKHEDLSKSHSHSQSQKLGNSTSVFVSEKSSSKLKKEKKDKEKRGSVFGNLKRSLFGKK